MPSRWPIGVPANPAAATIMIGALAALVPCGEAAGQEVQSRSLRMTEVFRVRAADADFSVVGVVVRSSSGVVWISQPQDARVLGFDPRSTTPRAVGRAGEGPGDFSLISSFASSDAGTWVYDGQVRRLTLIDGLSGRREERRVTYPPRLGPAVSVVSAGPNRVYYRTGGKPRFVGRPLSQDDTVVTLHVADPDGRAARPYLQYRHRPCGFTAEIPDGRHTIAVPFCHRSAVAVSPNGAFAAIIEPLAAENDRTGVSIEIHDSLGDRLGHGVRWLGASRIAGTRRDSALKALRSRANSAVGAELTDRIIRTGAVPVTIPPIDHAVIGDDGSAWIVVRSGTAASRSLVGFTKEGRYIGQVGLDDLARVGWAGDNLILLVEPDDDGLQDVVLYRVDSPEG